MPEKVIAILSEYSVLGDIQLDSMLEADLGLSSFDVVSIAAEFEDEFHIEIPDRDISRFSCVRDIVEYLEAKT